MNALRKVSLFKDLTDAELKELEPYLATQTVRKKETIFSEGEPPEWFYLVLSGKVKVTKISHEGKEIILEVISPTDIFGGVAVIRGFPYPANAVAIAARAAPGDTRGVTSVSTFVWTGPKTETVPSGAIWRVTSPPTMRTPR